MVTAKFALTKEDYVTYCTYVLWDAPGRQKKRLVYYLRQLLPLAVFMLAFYYTGLFDRQPTFVLLIAALMIGTGILSVTARRSNVAREAEKIANNPDNHSVFEEVIFTATENGIQVKSEYYEELYKWKAFIRKLENKNYYYLFHNANQAVIVPKRIFYSTEHREQFDKLLVQHLSLEAEMSQALNK